MEICCKESEYSKVKSSGFVLYIEIAVLVSMVKDKVEIDPASGV